MRRTVAASALAAGLLVASAGGAFAAGNSDQARIHPGHQGAVSSGDYHGVPTIHYHFVGPYEKWGTAVSDAAQGQGIPAAHG